MERTGLNAKAVFIDNNKTLKQVAGQFVESLPINSKLTIYEEIKELTDDMIIVINKRLVFAISQKMTKKHPVNKQFESHELKLRFINYLAKMPEIQEIIK